MKKWIIVKLAATLLCVNSFALDRYEREEIDRVMTEIYDQAEHTEQFIGAWNKAQDLLQAVGGIGGHKEARPENSRLRALLDCKDLSEAEKGFLYMRGLLCAASGLLKVREQAEKLSLRIGFGSCWDLEVQRWWRHCLFRIKSSLDPIEVMQDAFPDGRNGWANRMRDAAKVDVVFYDLCSVFQRKVAWESIQVCSFFCEGEAYELAKHIIGEGYQHNLHRYEMECHYAGIVGIEGVAGSVPRSRVQRLSDFCNRWGVPQREVSITRTSQKLSWLSVAQGLEGLVPYTQFASELFLVLSTLQDNIERCVNTGELERCDDEGVVKRICAVFRERPDFKRSWDRHVKTNFFSESMKEVYANCDMTPLKQGEGQDSEQDVDFHALNLGELKSVFTTIEECGDSVVVEEYNRCAGLLQIAFPDLRCVERPKNKECGLIEFIELASCEKRLPKHRLLNDLCRVLQESLHQKWEGVQRTASAIFDLKGEDAVEEMLEMRKLLAAGAACALWAVSVFPKLKGLLKKYRDFDVFLHSGEVDAVWGVLGLS